MVGRMVWRIDRGRKEKRRGIMVRGMVWRIDWAGEKERLGK